MLYYFSSQKQKVCQQSFFIVELLSLQRDDGSYYCSADSGDCDVRFIYCACVISALIGDWSGIDKSLAASYIRSCITYEGGIALFSGIHK
jgi:prenyltransferase beta subunit